MAPLLYLSSQGINTNLWLHRYGANAYQLHFKYSKKCSSCLDSDFLLVMICHLNSGHLGTHTCAGRMVGGGMYLCTHGGL